MREERGREALRTNGERSQDVDWAHQEGAGSRQSTWKALMNQSRVWVITEKHQSMTVVDVLKTYSDQGIVTCTCTWAHVTTKKVDDIGCFCDSLWLSNQDPQLRLVRPTSTEPPARPKPSNKLGRAEWAICRWHVGPTDANLHVVIGARSASWFKEITDFPEAGSQVRAWKSLYRLENFGLILLVHPSTSQAAALYKYASF